MQHNLHCKLWNSVACLTPGAAAADTPHIVCKTRVLGHAGGLCAVVKKAVNLLFLFFAVLGCVCGLRVLRSKIDRPKTKNPLKTMILRTQMVHKSDLIDFVEC